MALAAKAKEVTQEERVRGGSVNVGGLRQRSHYVNKCYSDFAVYKCTAGKKEEDKFWSCSIVTANKPNYIKSRYRSILMKHMNVELRHKLQCCTHNSCSFTFNQRARLFFCPHKHN